MKYFTHRARAPRSRFVLLPAVGLAVVGVTAMFMFTGSALSAQANVPLGNADSFGALSSAAMTNAGANTVVNGEVGSSTSIDSGVTHPGFTAYGAGSSQLAGGQASLLGAYNFAEAQTPTQPTITGANLAGQTLSPGVYNSTSGILISGPVALTLDGGGDPNAVFIFQAASSGDLTVDPTSSVSLINGAQACHVFWKVNSAFLKNTDSVFVGTILALTQITLTDSITVEGRLLARNADVTFIHDVVNRPSCITAPPPVVTTPTATTPTATTPTATTPTPTVTTPTATTPAPSLAAPPPSPVVRVKKPTAAKRPVVAKKKVVVSRKVVTGTKKTSVAHAPPAPKPPKHAFGLTG